MNDGNFPSDEELVEEEDETTAAVEVEESDDGEETSDSSGEEEEDEGKDDVTAPVAKKRKKAPLDIGWLREVFHLVASEPDYFCDGEKRSKARERIMASLRKKKIDKTARNVKGCVYSWIWNNSTPQWLTKEETVILKKMRKTAERLKGSSNQTKKGCSRKMSKSFEWSQLLFKELVKIPDYFEMKDKRSANRKIVECLRKKKIDWTSEQVSGRVFRLIWCKKTPQWMSVEETAALEEMRKAAERLKGNIKSIEFGKQLFQQLVKIPKYFEMEDKRSANEKIVECLRKKKIIRTTRQVSEAVQSWIVEKRTPLWMSEEDRAILEKMRETAERFNGKRTYFGQQLFQHLKNTPKYFEMEDKRSANKKIVECLRKNNIIRTTADVTKRLFCWIWEKQTPPWMSQADRAILEKMRENAEKSRKRKKAKTPVSVKKNRPPQKRKRVQKTPEVSEDEEESTEEKDEAGNEPKTEEDPVEEQEMKDDEGKKMKKKKLEGKPSIHLDGEGVNYLLKSPSKKRRMRIQEAPEDAEKEAEEEEQRDIALHENEDQVFEDDEQAEVREKENEVELEGQEDDDYDFNELEAYDLPFEVEPMDVFLPPGDVNSEIRSPDRTIDSDSSTESFDGLADLEDSSDFEPFDPMGDVPSPDDIIPETSNTASAPTNEEIEALLQKYAPRAEHPPPIEQKKTKKSPAPQELRIYPDEEEPTRHDSLLVFYDEIEKYKKREAEKDNEILKLEKKIVSKDEELKKKSEEIEALKKKLSELQKRPEEVSEKADEVRERDVPEELKPLLELKGRVVGTTNTYRIQQALGCGTFGLVFRVEHTETKEVSALKVVVDEEVMEEELRVMERMKQFEEKNEYICAPSDFFRGSHNGVDFIAFSMELLPIDLFSLFWNDEHKKKKFTSEPVLQILAQLFSALDFLSRHGIVYSDVKQENLMVKKFDVETRGDEDLVRNPVVRLIDFNSIREIGDSSLCQTARFRAPEVILGLAFDARIDSWSAGILALELLEKDYYFHVEYPVEDKNTPYEHLALISFALSTTIPDAMWAASSLDIGRFPKEIGDQLSVAEVFEEMKSSEFTVALQKVVTQLLAINPKDRPSPNEALSIVEDLLPK